MLSTVRRPLLYLADLGHGITQKNGLGGKRQLARGAFLQKKRNTRKTRGNPSADRRPRAGDRLARGERAQVAPRALRLLPRLRRAPVAREPAARAQPVWMTI